MKHASFLAVVAAVAPALLHTPACRAETPMTYIYNAPESQLDKRYEYQWEILKAALEQTAPQYGPHRMVVSETMSERRQEQELKTASGKLTIMYLDATADREKILIPIRIPVDKSLVGYRVLLIRKEDQTKFSAVRTLDDLRRYSCGQGLGWIDVDLLKAERFKVVTGSSYDGLFEMLLNKRFDMFSRGANEIIGEFDARKKDMPEMAIEQNLLLYYPAPMYFWFSKTEDGKRLAARVEAGMRKMIEDGSYDRIFETFYRANIDQLKLKERRLLKLENPFLTPETPLGDKRLWFDPAKN